MTRRPEFRASRERQLQCSVRELWLPGSDAPMANVYFPGIAVLGDAFTPDVSLRAPRHAVAIPVYREPRGTHLRDVSCGHIAAGFPAGPPQLDAEIKMVENSTNLPMAVEMTGSTPCSDAESFSGYIITTNRSK